MSLSERLEPVDSFPSELRGVELPSWLSRAFSTGKGFFDGFGGGFGGCSACLAIEDLRRVVSSTAAGVEPRLGRLEDCIGIDEVVVRFESADSSEDSGVLLWRGVASADIGLGDFFCRGNVKRSLYSSRFSGDNETVMVGCARGVGLRAAASKDGSTED